MLVSAWWIFLLEFWEFAQTVLKAVQRFILDVCSPCLEVWPDSTSISRVTCCSPRFLVCSQIMRGQKSDFSLCNPQTSPWTIFSWISLNNELCNCIISLCFLLFPVLLSPLPEACGVQAATSSQVQPNGWWQWVQLLQRLATWPLQGLWFMGSEIVCSHQAKPVTVSGKSAVVSCADRRAPSVWDVHLSQVPITFHSSPVHLEHDGTFFTFCRNFWTLNFWN